MGQVSIEMTANIYVHPDVVRKKDMAAQLSGSLLKGLKGR